VKTKQDYASMLNKEITKESYQTTAKEFARNVANMAPLESIEKFITLLPPNAKILDIGCGSGRDAKIFTDNGANVLGIDFSSQLLDIAKTHAPRAEFLLMDIETLNLPAASFDGAWAACSLGHIPKSGISSTLKQIRLLLKENGYFYLALKQGSGELLENDLRYEGNPQKFWAYYEEGELQHLLQESGFKILDFKTIEKQFPYQTHRAFRVFCQSPI
jgi:ubiquinone/menaquinone biosynthesis C-methylase UbiE